MTRLVDKNSVATTENSPYQKLEGDQGAAWSPRITPTGIPQVSLKLKRTVLRARPCPRIKVVAETWELSLATGEKTHFPRDQ